MITKDTHSIDWNKTAQVTGVVLLTLGKGIWWLTKHVGMFLFAALAVFAKVFIAMIAVSASASAANNEHDDGTREIKSCDDNGCDLNTGLPVSNRF